MPPMEFKPYPKIPRLFRDIIITEKIDGTNGQISIFDGKINGVGSRKRWLNASEDNHGFFKWATANAEQLFKDLGEGVHFGEWWGAGINKRYPGAPKTFSLFNTDRWTKPKADGLLTLCNVVPILYQGPFGYEIIEETIDTLDFTKSIVWPPSEAEGIIIFHIPSQYMFKVTLLNDAKPKGDIE